MPPQLHPRHGPHEPSLETPARRVGSVRRTGSLDFLRPEGLAGPVLVHARGRDLGTGQTASVVLDEVALKAQVAYLDGMSLTAISTDPPETALTALVGESLRRGFRARVQGLLPAQSTRESVLDQLLDDLPMATLVSGVALSLLPQRALEPRITHPTQDICAGWRRGGTIMLELARSGRPPRVVGPVVTALPSSTDQSAWHRLPALPPHGMRRARRTDVWLEDDAVHVESFFRDSHRAGEDPERAVHEYTVRATYDPREETFTAVAATPGALPWQECPAALGSAAAIIGLRPDQLRALAGARGIGTCTHLTDQLRSLAAVPALLSAAGSC